MRCSRAEVQLMLAYTLRRIAGPRPDAVRAGHAVVLHHPARARRALRPGTGAAAGDPRESRRGVRSRPAAGRAIRALSRGSWRSGDLGPSFRYKDFRVTELIARGLPLTLTIGLAAALLAFLVGVPLGALRGMARQFVARSRAHGFLDAGRGAAGIRRRAAAGAGVRNLLADVPRRRLRARAT